MKTWREILNVPDPDLRTGSAKDGDNSDKTISQSVSGPPSVTIVTTSSETQPQADEPRPTTFKLSFFSQLALIRAANRSDLLESGRRQGIPRECAEAFWRSKQRMKESSGA